MQVLTPSLLILLDMGFESVGFTFFFFPFVTNNILSITVPLFCKTFILVLAVSLVWVECRYALIEA